MIRASVCFTIGLTTLLGADQAPPRPKPALPVATNHLSNQPAKAQIKGGPEKIRRDTDATRPANPEAKPQPGHEHRTKTTNSRKLTPAEWKAKRVEFHQRLKRNAEVLRAKKADGTLTEAEQRRLNRMEELLKRFQANEESSDPPSGTPSGTPAPPPTQR